VAVREQMRGREGKWQAEENNVMITGVGGIRGNIEGEEYLEREIRVKVNVKEAFKIYKDKIMLAEIESWEQKFDKRKKENTKEIK
jgi:hypothetical protein